MNKIITFLAIALFTIPTHLFGAQSRNLESVLLEAASAGQAEIVKSFLDNGANIEFKNDLGATPLIFASAKGHAEVVSLLLDRGAKVNAKTSTGITPLMAAASGGYADIAKILVAKGADVCAKDKEGRTALSMAEASDDSEVSALLKSAAKSCAQARPRVASRDSSSSRQSSNDYSDSGSAEIETSDASSDFGQGNEASAGGPAGGPLGGLLDNPIIQQGLGRVLGAQQSGSGNVAAIQNVDPGAQMQPPAKGGNAQQQLPPQAGNAQNQPPAQARGADPNLVVTPYTDQSGFSGTKSFSPATGETQVTATKHDPKTGAVTEINTITDSSGKQISGTSTKTSPDNDPNNKGGQKIVKQELGLDGQLTKLSETQVSPKGNVSKTTNFDPKTFGKTSEVIVQARTGRTITENYSGCQRDGKGCILLSDVVDDSKTGKRTTTNFDKDGKVIGTQVTNIPKDHQQQATAQAAMGKAKALKENARLRNRKVDDKKKVQADVLKQIGGKPSKDLKGAKDKLKTTGTANKIKNRGRAVQLNPQPLPPGPPEKLGKKGQFDNKKLKTGSNKKILKEDFPKGAATHGSNFKEKTIQQGQFSNQFSEGSKHKSQNWSSEQFNGKTKSHGFNQPAGGRRNRLQRF